MLNKKTLLIVSLSFVLTGCTSVTGLFTSSEEEETIQGKRISVLELQKSLKAETPLEEGQVLDLPDKWNNLAWPQAGGYPNHTMHNLSLGEDLKRIWSTKIGRGSSDDLPLTAQPVAAAGKVFTLDSRARLSAFDATTGKKVWDKKLSNKDEDDPVITGGVSFAHKRLYVTNGYDEVMSIEPEDGEIIWRKHLSAPSRAAPTAINGRVFVSTVDSKLTAFSAKDGSNLWAYSGIEESAGLLATASPAANNDIVIPAFSSGEVTALRVENGAIAWSDNLAKIRKIGGGKESLADIAAMPLVDRGIVIAISFSGKLVAIDERTGNRIWQRNISGIQTPWIAGTNLFVLTSDNQVIAINMVNGSIYWIKELAKFENEKKKSKPLHWHGPLMASDRLLLAGSDGKIIEMDPNTGDITKTTKTKKTIRISPIIAQKTLYILAEDGTLVAYQ